MSNLLTILRRELRAYWESPIGYLFVIVFLLVTVGLYISPFFAAPRAEMRNFFGIVPIVLCVFIPAVTMRLWAEDRKENTWELLLTFPMQPWELVCGKFFAALVFFGMALAGTLTIPLMLFWLGAPDLGPILGAYFGTVLLGAFFLAMGIFFSALFTDQIVAFVVTLLACFGVFLLGTDFMTIILDGVLPGLGSTLAQLVGVTGHYNSFGRGVVEVGDLLYFVVWTSIFLFLNGLFLQGRSRPGVRAVFGTAVALGVGIGLAFNWVIGGRSLLRFDLTADKIYTVSEATRSILKRLVVPVQVKLYITPRDKMPAGMKQLEQDILDKLEEMSLSSGGRLRFQAIHLEASNALAALRREREEEAGPDGTPKKKKNEKDEALEKRMLDKGVEPFSVQALEQDQVTSMLVYSSIGVAYRDKEEEILPQVLPQSLEQLEYRLVNTIFKMTRDAPPSVALVAPMSDLRIDPQIVRLLQQMGRPVPRQDDQFQSLQRILEAEKYQVSRVKLNQKEPLPEKLDTLVVVSPSKLNDRQRYEINRALVQGKSVLLAVQQYEWDYQVRQRDIDAAQRNLEPGVNEFLSAWGVEVDTELLMDGNHQALTLQDPDNPLAAMMGSGLTVNLPTHVMVTPAAMNEQVSMTAQIGGLFYLWGTALKLDEAKLAAAKLEKTLLFSTSPGAWKAAASGRLDGGLMKPEGKTLGQYPLAVMVKGQFPDAFPGRPRPEWPKENQQQPEFGGMEPPAPPDRAAEPLVPAPGKLIVIGCAEMFRKGFLGQEALDFFLNCVDALTLGEELPRVRGKKTIDRSIARPSDAARAVWKFVNLGLVNCIVAAIGIVGGLLRRRSREAYTLSFQK